jgi:hypothetical protein
MTVDLAAENHTVVHVIGADRGGVAMAAPSLAQHEEWRAVEVAVPRRSS